MSTSTNDVEVQDQVKSVNRKFADEVMCAFERYQRAALHFQIIEQKARILRQEGHLPKDYAIKRGEFFRIQRAQIHVLGRSTKEFLLSLLTKDPSTELKNLLKLKEGSTVVFRSTETSPAIDKIKPIKERAKVSADEEQFTTSAGEKVIVNTSKTGKLITINAKNTVHKIQVEKKATVEIAEVEEGAALVTIQNEEKREIREPVTGKIKETTISETVALTINDQGDQVKIISSKDTDTVKSTSYHGVVILEGNLFDDPVWRFVDLIIPGDQPLPKNAALAVLDDERSAKQTLECALLDTKPDYVLALSNGKNKGLKEITDHFQLPFPPVPLSFERLPPEVMVDMEVTKMKALEFIDCVAPRFRVLLVGQPRQMSSFLSTLHGSSLVVPGNGKAKFVNWRTTKYEHVQPQETQSIDESAFSKLCASDTFDGTLVWYGPLSDDWNVEFLCALESNSDSMPAADLVVELSTWSQDKSFFDAHENDYRKWVKVVKISVLGDKKALENARCADNNVAEILCDLVANFCFLLQGSLRDVALVDYLDSSVSGVISIGGTHQEDRKLPVLVIIKPDETFSEKVSKRVQTLRATNSASHQCSYAIDLICKSALVSDGRKALIAFAREIAQFQQRLQVLVLGEFNAGKTTFLNSLGDPMKPILQVSARANTAGIVTLRHVPKGSRYYYSCGKLRRELTTKEFSDLNDLEKGQTKKHLLVVGDLFTRDEFSYIDFVDTRGGGDSEDFHAASQCKFAEGAIIIGTCTTPATGQWMKICKEVIKDHGPEGIFMYMNKVGHLEQDSDVEMVKDNMKRHCKELGCPEIPDENYVDFRRNVRGKLTGETHISDGFLLFLSQRVKKRTEILEKELAQHEDLVESWWDQSRSSSYLVLIIFHLMQYCFHGTRLTRSACEYAKDSTAHAVIRSEAAAAGSIAFLSNLAPLIVLPVVLPAQITLSYFTRMHTAFSVAAVHGRDLHSPAVCRAVLRCFTSDSPANIRDEFHKDYALDSMTNEIFQRATQIGALRVGQIGAQKVAEIGTQKATEIGIENAVTVAAKAIAQNVAAKVYKQQLTYQLNRALARGMSEQAAKQIAIEAATKSQAKAFQKRLLEEVSQQVGQRMTAQATLWSAPRILSFVSRALPVVFGVVSAYYEIIEINQIGCKADAVFKI